MKLAYILFLICAFDCSLQAMNTEPKKPNKKSSIFNTKLIREVLFKMLFPEKQQKMTPFLVNHILNKELAEKKPKKNDGVKKDEKKEQKGDNFEYKLKQLKVESQRGNTCGFHALKNGILVGRGYWKELTDPLISESLFGMFHNPVEMGFWIRDIINRRSQIAIEQDLLAKLKKHTILGNTTLDPEVQKCAQQIVQDTLAKLARISAQRVVEEGDHAISMDDIKKELTNLVILQSNTNDLYAQNMNAARKVLKENCSLVESFLNKDFKVAVKRDDVEAAINLYNKNARSQGLNPLDPSGELLDSGELERLIKEERQHGFLQDSGLPITVIENTDLIGNNEIGDFYGLEEIKKKILNGNYTHHSFLIGTMRNDNENGSGSSGHWYTFVVRPEGMYVADSLGNTDRTNDPRVKKIIEAIGLDNTLKIKKPEKMKNAEKKIEKYISKLENSINDSNEKKQFKYQLELMEWQSKYQEAGGDPQEKYGEKLNKIIKAK
jgi:hypothetical protein